MPKLIASPGTCKVGLHLNHGVLRRSHDILHPQLPNILGGNPLLPLGDGDAMTRENFGICHVALSNPLGLEVREQAFERHRRLRLGGAFW